MKNIWTIAKKDFRSYVSSPIAYIVIAVFLLIMGWMFFFILQHFVQQASQFQQFQMGKGPSIAEAVIRPIYGNMNVVLLFLIPFITMRLFAEEKKNHTIELLMTSPVTLTEIIMGKFLSSFMLVSVMIGCTLLYPLILILTGNPDKGTIFTSVLGTLLLASCYLGLGLIFSAATENQIVAGALTLASGLFFWIVSWASQSAGPVWSEVLTYISIITHFNNFSQGILTTTDTFFYISFVGVCLFLCHRILDSFRWR